MKKFERPKLLTQFSEKSSPALPSVAALESVVSTMHLPSWSDSNVLVAVTGTFLCKFYRSFCLSFCTFKYSDCLCGGAAEVAKSFILVGVNYVKVWVK